MPINQGISTDMTTAHGEDAESSIEFVEDPGAQNLNLSYEYQVNSGGGMMAQEYPKDLNPAEDENDISWEDIGSTVSQVGKNIYEGAEAVGRAVGLVGPEKKEKETPKPIKKELPKIKQPTLPSKGSQSIKDLQEYFAKPSALFNSFVPGIKYSGNIDGDAGPMTQKVANAVENVLSNLLETNNVRGIVLRTTPQDIESALSKAAEYRRYKKEKTSISMTRDERFYKLSKILISSR
jgi:hypothetical protein